MILYHDAGGDDSPICRTTVSEGASSVCALWHPRIKQIVVGSADAAVRVFYSPTISQKGALMSAAPCTMSFAESTCHRSTS